MHAWQKDVTSRAPATVYVAPDHLHPMTAVVHTPGAASPWAVEWAYFVSGETQQDVETRLGL